jgi:hypothetical protein
MYFTIITVEKGTGGGGVRNGPAALYRISMNLLRNRNSIGDVSIGNL